MNFKELKEDILSRAKQARACSDEYIRAYKAETKEELLQVITDNIAWCYKEKMLDTEYMILHFEDLFPLFGICTSGHHELKDCSAILLGSSSATIKTCNSSSATIETFDSSSATIKTWDSSSATIETCNSSSATYELSGDYSTIKDLNKLKLFVKKSKFEIVEV
jgi:hypothetical protein